jgi:nucleolar protein 14
LPAACRRRRRSSPPPPLTPPPSPATPAPQRKSTLLVEYAALRKSNAFVDRRFGEDDASLTADERALARFQRQRMRELAGGRFALPDDDVGAGGGEQLTHLGRALAETGGGGLSARGWGSDDDDDEDGGRMGAAATREDHFGGGLFEKAAPRAEGKDGEDGGHSERRRSKKEVMEEVIAKSKAFKAARQAAREGDLEATDKLDAEWAALAAAPGGVVGAMTRARGEKAAPPPGGAPEGDLRFDALTRELLFEARAAPGERTLAPEELAELERARLEALEAARLRRQRADAHVGGDDLDDDFGGDGGAAGGGGGAVAPAAGGYAARRQKRARLEAEAAERAAKRAKRGAGAGAGSDEGGSGSGSGSGEEGSGSEDGSGSEEAGGGLEARRQARAAGAHPLQAALRGVAERLLAKHGDPAAAAAAAAAKAAAAEEGDASEGSEEEGGAGSGSSGDEEERGGERGGEGEEAPAAPAPAAEEAALARLSFTPPLPQSYAEFASLAAGLAPAELGEALRRVRGFHAAALAGEGEGRRRLQLLYGCAAQHFAALAAASPPPLDALGALLPHLAELTPQVPFYAATAARARLVRAHARLAGALRAPGAAPGGPWPRPATLCLLRLYAQLFPASDRRHPVLTPAALLAGAALTGCPLARPAHAASGLLLASTLLHLNAEARRFAPEPLAFAAALLAHALPAGAAREARVLSLAGAPAGALPARAADVAPLRYAAVLAALAAGDAAFFEAPAFKASAAAAAARLVGRAAELLADSDSLPELAAPAAAALRAVAAAGAAPPRGRGAAAAAPPGVAPGVAEVCAEVLARVEALAAAAAGRRVPLRSAALGAPPERRAFNPRFEEKFAAGRDYDPDRERSDRRRLEKEVHREERGAARELRRDAAFMAGVRDRERAAAQGALDASARRAVSFLQAQEADAKSGGQGGHWKKKGGRGRR